jgi:hypothetical protein
MKLDGLELILKSDTEWYWVLDYRYHDGLDGIYKTSINYTSDREAIWALIENRIEWEN